MHASSKPYVSVIVPSRNRSDKLVCLLLALSRQILPDGLSFEVLIGLDGGEIPDYYDLPSLKCQFFPLPQVGISAAKNHVIDKANGEILLFLNDDIEPDQDFINAHITAQEHTQFQNLVLGKTDWNIDKNPTVFDRMIAQSPMIFFYSNITENSGLNFRYAWNLNLSMPKSVFEKVGQFNELFRPCMYEDIELAWRLEQLGHHVYYSSKPFALHNHSYTWESYLRREIMLGMMASVFWQVNRECFLDIFKMPLDDLRDHAKTALQMDSKDSLTTFHSLSRLFVDSAPAPLDNAELQSLYLAHLPVKRRAFRYGLLEGCNMSIDQWQSKSDVVSNVVLPDSLVNQPLDPASVSLSIDAGCMC